MLRENQLGILSLIDGILNACCVGDLREHIAREQDRYMGWV